MGNAKQLFFWAMVLVLSARFELANRCDYRYRRVERWTLNLKKTKNQVDSALERHVYHIWTENIYSSTSKYEVPGTFFSPICFVNFVFLQQLCCFQYNRAGRTTPYGKQRISLSKLRNPLQSILEEIFNRLQSFRNDKRITKIYALLCLYPVLLCLCFESFCSS